MSWDVEKIALMEKIGDRAAELDCAHVCGYGYCGENVNHGNCVLIWTKAKTCDKMEPTVAEG